MFTRRQTSLPECQAMPGMVKVTYYTAKQTSNGFTANYWCFHILVSITVE